jgi:hypothetical protein
VRTALARYINININTHHLYRPRVLRTVLARLQGGGGWGGCAVCDYTHAAWAAGGRSGEVVRSVGVEARRAAASVMYYEVLKRERVVFAGEGRDGAGGV